MKTTIKTMMAVAAFALAIGSAKAQIIGTSTVAEVEKAFGQPQFTPDKPIKGYIAYGHIIGVFFDDKGICQAVVLVNPGGPMPQNDASLFDRLCLPAGNDNWARLPVESMQNMQTPGGTLASIYMTTHSNTVLFVIAGMLDSKATIRAYATMAGALLMQKQNQPNWSAPAQNAPNNNQSAGSQPKWQDLSGMLTPSR